jgi:hypothetical protein
VLTSRLKNYVVDVSCAQVFVIRITNHKLMLRMHGPCHSSGGQTETRFQSRATSSEICGGRSGTGAGFSPSSSVLPC